MSSIVLLNQSIDAPGTLLVNNRYLRLGMRAVAVVILLCLPINSDLSNRVYLGTIAGLLQATVWWEYITGLERGAKLIEPREKRER
jgi:hypothetical protein